MGAAVLESVTSFGALIVSTLGSVICTQGGGEIGGKKYRKFLLRRNGGGGGGGGGGWNDFYPWLRIDEYVFPGCSNNSICSHMRYQGSEGMKGGLHQLIVLVLQSQ